jgi:hypothetical protein
MRVGGEEGKKRPRERERREDERGAAGGKGGGASQQGVGGKKYTGGEWTRVSIWLCTVTVLRCGRIVGWQVKM